jgi:hypothetical protein
MQIELLNRKKWRTKMELSIAIAELSYFLLCRPDSSYASAETAVSADRLGDLFFGGLSQV